MDCSSPSKIEVLLTNDFQLIFSVSVPGHRCRKIEKHHFRWVSLKLFGTMIPLTLFPFYASTLSCHLAPGLVLWSSFIWFSLVKYPMDPGGRWYMVPIEKWWSLGHPLLLAHWDPHQLPILSIFLSLLDHSSYIRKWYCSLNEKVLDLLFFINYCLRVFMAFAEKFFTYFLKYFPIMW